MKYVLLTLLTLLTVSTAYGNTYYSKATARTCDSAKGKVYISTSATSAPVYNVEVSATNSGSSTSHEYYLYAQPEAGFDFYRWVSNNNTVGTTAEFTATVTASSKEEASPTLAEFTAEFIKHPQVRVTSSAEYGVAEIDKPENEIGDIVTIKAIPAYNISTTSIMPTNVPNRAVRFNGWKDQDGVTVSKEKEYTFTIDKEQLLTADFDLEPGIQTSEGYYRVMTGWNAAFRVSGDFSINLTGQEQFYGDLDLIRNPEGYGYGYSNHKSYCRYNGDPHNNIYSDPGTVMYVTGTLNESNALSYEKSKDVMTGVSIANQGTGTDKYLSGQNVKIKWHLNPGYYTVYCSVAALKFQESASRWSGGDVLYPGRDDNSSQTMLHFEPIDEAHADEYWFGMFPYAEMNYADGYWTSLYTSFPYKTYEADNVEVYIIESLSDGVGDVVAVLKKIESGVVPANTAVLLKCRDLIDTDSYVSFNEKGQSLIAAGQARMPKPSNRLIPLLPGDSSIDETEFAGNMLKGTFQLNQAYPDKNDQDKDLGHELFDANTMRVFSVNDAGVVGFYKVAENTELAPNKAYLDVSSLTPAQLSKAIRIVMADESGIVNISYDDVPFSGDVEYFTLHGVKVSQPQAGHIYLVRRGGKVTKELVR